LMRCATNKLFKNVPKVRSNTEISWETFGTI
jgi:hypothetical protein